MMSGQSSWAVWRRSPRMQAMSGEDLTGEAADRRPGIAGFLAVFGIATGLVVVAIIVASWLLDATKTPAEMAAAQARDRALVALPFDLRYYGPLKLARLKDVQPEVVFIGPSRCNAVRSAMLRPYRFYNACLSAWTLPQLIRTLDRIVAISHPRVVIVSLDYFVLGPKFENGFASRNGDFREGLAYLVQAFSATALALVDHFDGTIRCIRRALDGSVREPVDGLALMGLAARRAEAGFRWDGSFLPERGFVKSAAKNNADPTNGLVHAMPGAMHIGEAQMLELAQLARIARAHGITLVAIQLPIFHLALEFLDGHPETADFGIWREFETPAARASIEELGIVFFDLARDPVTEDPRNFLDPAHPSEGGMLGALVHLSGDPRFRSIFPDLDAEGLRHDYADALARGDLVDVYHVRF
jgi:hypothetical protein